MRSTMDSSESSAMASGGATPSQPFDRFTNQKTIVLTTYRRDGTPVPTPVHIAVDGPLAYIRTFDPSGKLKRMRRTADVEIAPSTIRGRITGDTLRARARVLSGDEAETAATAMAAKYPFLHGRFIPWYHRRKHLVTTEIVLPPR